MTEPAWNAQPGDRRGTAPEPRWWADLGGPVHYVDHGGPADGPLLVLVHGLGGSLLNWAAVGPELARTCRVLALDLAGFGRTPGGERSTSVHANQQLLHRFITDVAGVPAVLVGNSMGGLITVLQAAEHPETVAAAALIDSALPVGPRVRPDPLVAAVFTAYTVPAVGRAVLGSQRRLRSPEATALALLRLCCVDASRVHPDVVAQHVGLARERHDQPDTDAELLVAARSLLWVLARRRRYAELMRAMQMQVLLLHGEKDRLTHSRPRGPRRRRTRPGGSRSPGTSATSRSLRLLSGQSRRSATGSASRRPKPLTALAAGDLLGMSGAAAALTIPLCPLNCRSMLRPYQGP